MTHGTHPRQQRRTTAQRLRRAGRVGARAVLAAAGAGVLTSAPARVLMRLVALAAGHATRFSWVGTLGIALVFTAAVLPGALVSAAWTGRGHWLVLAAGSAVLCVPATGVASQELGSTNGYSGRTWVEVGAASAGVYLCIAALPLITLRLIAAARPIVDADDGSERFRSRTRDRLGISSNPTRETNHS